MSDDKQQPESVYVWWSDIDQQWRIRKWDMQPFVEGTKYTREENEGYPGIAHDLETMRTALEDIVAAADADILRDDAADGRNFKHSRQIAAAKAALNNAATQGGKSGEHSSERLGQPAQKADVPASGPKKETTALPPAVAAPCALSTAAVASCETDYKVLWERDSASLGKCLQEIHTLRAVKEDQRAKIVGLERELAATREDLFQQIEARNRLPSSMARSERLLTIDETLSKISAEFDGRLWKTANDDIQLRLFSRYEAEAVRSALSATGPCTETDLCRAGWLVRENEAAFWKAKAQEADAKLAKSATGGKPE